MNPSNIRELNYGPQKQILTILSGENPSNIRELNYGPRMRGANKLTGKMELVLLRMSEFHCLVMVLCFNAFNSIRSNFRKWFVSQKMEPLSLRSTSRGARNAQVIMNMLAIR